MTAILPIDPRDLISGSRVESVRLEFKKTWSEQTLDQVIRSVCAFGNDIHNLNGGYIVLGVEEQNGVGKLPPTGLDPDQLDEIQKTIRGNAKRIDPELQPIMSPEIVDGLHILILMVPGSKIRPHQAPESKSDKGRHFWVRQGSETVKAKGRMLRDLLQMAGDVPFDDRANREIPVEKISETLVREFLVDIDSRLGLENDAQVIYRNLDIVERANGHVVPRNIGLLFFANDPETVGFRGARIEVVHYREEGDVLDEVVFRGPLHVQLRRCISYLADLSKRHAEKRDDRAEVEGWVSFPYPALEEALANAVYHRDYQSREPIKVFLHPDRLEIISYPGPMPGVALDRLNRGESVNPVPARNKRVGELLKELRLVEGRYTGIPKLFQAMIANGSPRPRFDFDEARSYFRVTLPAHPEYVALAALRDVATLRALGRESEAHDKVREALADNPTSVALAVTYIELLAKADDWDTIDDILGSFPEDHPGKPRLNTAYADVLVSVGRKEDARRVLDSVPAMLSARDAFQTAYLERRLGREERAVRFFERAGDLVLGDVKALHEFAQAKIKLANNRKRTRPDARKHILREAQTMLRRVLQMDAPKTRHAWAWFDLARVSKWLGLPTSEIENAYREAIQLDPGEPRFSQDLDRFLLKKRR